MPTLRERTTRPEARRDSNSRLDRSPTTPNPLSAALHHPFLLLLPVLLFVGAAVAFGLTRAPEWKSEARLSVGELSPSTQSAPGIVEANQQLASAYSRALSASDVVARVGKDVGVPPGQVSGRLSASPIPESPLIRIEGTGASKREAVSITDAGTDGLVDYVRSLSSRNRELDRLGDQLADAKVEMNALERGVSDGPTTRELERARLRVKSLEVEYAEQSQQGGSTPITVLNPAEGATSDRNEILRLAVVIAALAGLAVGAALATGSASRRARRRPAYATY